MVPIILTDASITNVFKWSYAGDAMYFEVVLMAGIHILFAFLTVTTQ